MSRGRNISAWRMGAGLTEEWGCQLRLETHRDMSWVVGRERAS